jgi:3-phosphoglycerate kinase
VSKQSDVETDGMPVGHEESFFEKKRVTVDVDVNAPMKSPIITKIKDDGTVKTLATSSVLETKSRVSVITQTEGFTNEKRKESALKL